MEKEILTIHEVRRRLDRALELSENINKKYLDGSMQDSYELKSLYEYLRVVCNSHWTNQIL